MNKCPKCGHQWPDAKRAKGGKARWRGMTKKARSAAASDAAKARWAKSGNEKVRVQNTSSRHCEREDVERQAEARRRTTMTMENTLTPELPATGSAVICESGPLRWKTQINGVPKLQGVFTMRDQEGFPVDMSYEIAKERGWEVDWVEALADAARQCILKYDALIEEIRMLEPAKVESVQKIFAWGLMSCEGETFCDKAAHLYKRMRESHLPNKKVSDAPDSAAPNRRQSNE